MQPLRSERASANAGPSSSSSLLTDGQNHNPTHNDVQPMSVCERIGLAIVCAFIFVAALAAPGCSTTQALTQPPDQTYFEATADTHSIVFPEYRAYLERDLAAGRITPAQHKNSIGLIRRQLDLDETWARYYREPSSQ